MRRSLSCEWKKRYRKSGPGRDDRARTTGSNLLLLSGGVDVARPQLSKRRHEGGLLELQPTLHTGERRSCKKEPPQADFDADAESCLGASWWLEANNHQRSCKCLAQNGPFEDVERRQSVRDVFTTRPIASSGTRARLEPRGREPARQRSAGRSVGGRHEADTKGSLLLAPAIFPHRECGERRHIARGGGA
eukprot:872068-Prymnesium_polylepis.1